ncbi:menaquinone biosynthetic enzyme MqnA/MqnD family protein [Bythopirellula goksoeyrii]|uniref:Chorismate dehydratase n=1 Tax=Bythopirellula goksoeyrii TaxID=1400387 RepID=A0A5B9Q9B4_9BACT|nr:menaquinone biosynthesis protein [Bythopirellula goksoeyrii]QEG35607.1 Chorismate dehydratase [Bythopirellula goksoeyrii]
MNDLHQPVSGSLVGPSKALYNHDSITLFQTIPHMSTSPSPNKNCLRIGAVSYLNTKPLVYHLAERLPESQLFFDYPSRLSDALASGDLDIALVPSAELLVHPEWSIVSDACIACRGPVLSVKLLFRVPPAEVQTLAMDEGSRTSCLLAQILLREHQVTTPQLLTLPLGAQPQDVHADAVLIIGDRAIRCDMTEFVEVWDLGDHWCRSTELPFVFAMWVAGPGVDISGAAMAFEEARDEGSRNYPEIAQEQSVAMKLPEELVLEYLSKNLHFKMGKREKQGLDLFFQRATEYNLAPGALDSTSVGLTT